MARRSSLIDEDRIRDRLVALIRIPSITGVEDAGIGQIANWLQDSGAEVEYWNDGIAAIQRDPRYPGHEVERAWLPIVGGVIRGNKPGPSVLLTGHVDVVPPSNVDDWEYEPFSGVVTNDKVHGCGSSDMKSGLVAAMEAFLTFADGARDFAGRVIFLAVPAEEDSGLGTLAAIRRDWRGDVAIIPEPTAGADGTPELVIAQAGAMTITIEVPGRSAHASKRLTGESALEHFIPIFEAIQKDEQANNAGELPPLMKALGLPYPNSVGKINGGQWPSSVMESLTAEVRVGVGLHETVDEAFERFQRSIAEAIEDDAWLRDHPPVIRRKAWGFGSSQTPEDHPIVKAVASAGEHVFREAPRVVGAPFGCDMSAWVRHARVPTVIYGPGSIEMAHAPNEWVSLETTVQTTHVLVRAVEELLELDPTELRALNDRIYPPPTQESPSP